MYISMIYTSFSGCRGCTEFRGYGYSAPMVENQKENNIENQMGTCLMQGFTGILTYSKGQGA